MALLKFCIITYSLLTLVHTMKNISCILKTLMAFACLLFTTSVLTACSSTTDNSQPPTPYEKIGDVTELTKYVENGKTTLGELFTHLAPSTASSDYLLNTVLYTGNLKKDHKRVLVVQYWARYPGLRYKPNAVCKTTKNIIITLKDDNLNADNIVEGVYYTGASYAIKSVIFSKSTEYYHELTEQELKDSINFDWSKVYFQSVVLDSAKADSKKDKDEMQIVSDQLIPVLYEAPELKLVDEEMFKKTKLAFGNYSDTSSDTAIVPKIEKETDHYDYVERGFELPSWSYRVGFDFFLVGVFHGITYHSL
jgi:hypothetical protein